MRLIGYSRVSTENQTTDSQIDALRAAGCETIVEEVGSGADRARPALADLLQTIQSGETLVVVRLDRVARSLTHLLAVLETLKLKGCFFKSLSDPIDTGSPAGMLVTQIIGAVAEFERALTVERTKAGVRAAMARGKKPGNPGVRERRPRALAKIAKTKAENYDAEVARTASSWIPVVKVLRPRHSWEEVARVVNARGAIPQWTRDRLARFSKAAVGLRLLGPWVMKKTRQAGSAARLAMLVRTMIGAGLIPEWFESPEAMLMKMGERTPSGSVTWSPAAVAKLVKEGSEIENLLRRRTARKARLAKKRKAGNQRENLIAGVQP